MTAMTPDALTFVEEFADETAADSELQFQYLDRYRKVPVGPSVTLVFENAKTLNFRVHEVQTLRRVYPPATVRRMLDWYASLLPAEDRVSAAVQVRRPGRRPSPGLNDLADAVAEGCISLRIGDLEVPGELKATRAGDRILGPALWVTFAFDDAAREAIADFAPATVCVDAEGYCWESDPLRAEVRQSLCDDLSRRG
jgi:hypothetical protein